VHERDPLLVESDGEEEGKAQPEQACATFSSRCSGVLRQDEGLRALQGHLATCNLHVFSG